LGPQPTEEHGYDESDGESSQQHAIRSLLVAFFSPDTQAKFADRDVLPKAY
jgi:hypothetical protein